MCVHWYFAEYFLELSCPFFSKSKGRILDELRVSFNNTVSMSKLTKNAVMKHLLAVFLFYCLLLG